MPAPEADRYRFLTLLGRGGMGEVWRVHDAILDRVVAMKILAPSLGTGLRPRFERERRATAGLQHPGIVPVHDAGELPDGRAWFTMKEVEGETLAAILERAQAHPDGPWTLRRLVEVVHRVAEAVAYAHARGVLHRDLKPANIMVGGFGEVTVLDWGVARIGPEAREAPSPSTPAELTRWGEVPGTPAWMSPEQARGELDAIGPATDVYALGALLYAILSGGPPPSPSEGGWGEETPLPLPPGPEDLLACAATCLAARPSDRPADAAAVAEALGRWLDGAARRDRALHLVARADALGAAVLDATHTLASEEQRVAGLRRDVPTWAGVEARRRLWAAEADLSAAQGRLDALGAERVHLLHSAADQDPQAPEVRARLADHYQERQARAEASDDPLAADEAERWLRRYDDGRHARWLAGEGELTLHTDPPGALATLYTFEERDRRLVPRALTVLGPTPLVSLRLPRGTWLVELRAEGRGPVRYPVYLRRNERWDGVPPEGGASFPIHLPGALDDDERYVPAGWYTSGSVDRAVKGALPRRRIWLEAFVLRRHPVTVEAYLAFLNDLVGRGWEQEALNAAPRYRTAADQPTAWIFGRDDTGRFHLKPDNDGDVWSLTWPMFMVDHASAAAYARWEAERTGRPWRLPSTYEWEKAARGVDGRAWPWGGHGDPAFACLRESTHGRGLPAPIEGWPLDESVYGVRGLAGNVADWCEEEVFPEGPPVSPAGRPLPCPPGVAHRREARGGAWSFELASSRADVRFLVSPTDRRTDLGFRLCRTWHTDC